MATYTPNFNLSVPDDTDKFSDTVQAYRDNLVIIDNNLGGGNVDDVEVNGVSVLNSRTHIAEITSYKEVTQAEYDALPSSKLTDGIAYFIKDGGGGSDSGGSFLLMITANTGETVTATKDGITLTATEVSTGVYEAEVTSAGTWTISDGTLTATVDVGIYTATLSSVPEGSTVLPTDDISIWLACAERTENYTTLGEVLSDTIVLSALISSANAVDYMVRSTTWSSGVCADSSAMTFIGLNNYASNTLLGNSTWRNDICNSTYFESVLNVKVPTMTSNTQPYGVASASSAYDNRPQDQPYHAFDGTESTAWSPNTGQNSNYLQYEFVASQTFYKFSLKTNNRYTDASRVDTLTVSIGETEGSLANVYSYNPNQVVFEKSEPIAPTSGKVCRVIIAQSQGYKYCSVPFLQFYGRSDI